MFSTKSRVLIAGSSVILMFTFVPANSANIAGAKCIKLNATKTIANTKYTCLKSGKKLVWSKGIKIKSTSPSQVTPSPTPIISATPTPSPTPTPTPTTSSTPTPTPTPSPSPTKTPSFSERWNALDSTALDIFKIANAKDVPATHSNIFIWQPSSKAAADAVEEIKKRYDFAGRWWAPYGTSANPIKILVANLNEAEWICSIKLPWLNNTQPECVEVESNGQRDIPTAGQSQFRDKQIDMYQVASRARMEDYFFYGRIEHEFTHNIFYAQSTRYQLSVPCWLTEGGPEFYGSVIAFSDNPDLYIQVRNFNVYGNRLQNQSVTDWNNYLHRTDGTGSFPEVGDQCAAVRPELYKHGILPNEYLTWKLGVSGYLKLIKDASQSSWSASIQNTFGKTKDQLYLEIANYMKTQYDLIANNQWSIEVVQKIPNGR